MIKSENLWYSYSGIAPFVLSGVELDIKSGEYVSVVGENGSGKTTLMKLMLKLLKPTKGSIVSEARSVGYVPQRRDFLNSGFPITVYEMLDSYRKLLKIKDKSVITEKLRLLGLSDFSSAIMGTLSGGQGQKAVIARALLGSPELLVLDEPSTGVDNDSQKEIYGLLKSLGKDSGITIVSVEHNLAAAVANSTMIYHLAGGRGHICTPQNYANEYLNGRGNL
jgi:zinc transport system ATP-binding protein